MDDHLVHQDAVNKAYAVAGVMLDATPDAYSKDALAAALRNFYERFAALAHLLVHGPIELVTSSRRPVPLVWHFSTHHSLHPLLNEQGNEMNWRLNLWRTERERESDPFWDEVADCPRRKQRKLLRVGKCSKEPDVRNENQR